METSILPGSGTCARYVMRILVWGSTFVQYLRVPSLLRVFALGRLHRIGRLHRRGGYMRAYFHVAFGAGRIHRYLVHYMGCARKTNVIALRLGSLLLSGRCKVACAINHASLSGTTPAAGRQHSRPHEDPENVTDMLYEVLRTSLRVPAGSCGQY